MPGMKVDAFLFESPNPGPKERSCFHGGRKNALRRAYEGFGAKIMRPLTQGFWTKFPKQRLQPSFFIAIAINEKFKWLGMGEIQASFARQQEFPPYRWHGIKKVDPKALGSRHFGRHQS
jgi:hypothetical protein